MTVTPRSILLALLSLAAAVRAEPVTRPATWSSASIDAVLRPLVIDRMTDRYVAGAAVAVVKNGRTVYAEGFGDREVYSEDPVDPHTTIFRIGSVTKFLTAIAVLGLVDDGLVALDDDVDDHLTSLRVPASFEGPVRVRDLLRHTGGFDQIGVGRHAGSQEAVVPLAEFLDGELVRIRPAGQLAVYDTYGITLAGLLLEDVTGRSYEQVLRERIFEPLGMDRSGIRIDPAHSGDVAVGYGFAGSWEAMRWEWMNTPPASSVNATVTDMARLLEALLSDDAPGVLSDRSRRALWTVQHRNHPALPGVGLSLFEDPRHGHAGWSHGGSMEGFACLLYMLPDEEFGVFVAYNQESRGLADAVVEALLEALLPLDGSEADGPNEPCTIDASDLAGTYQSAMRNHTRPERGGWTATPRTLTVIDPCQVEFLDGVATAIDATTFVFDDGRRLAFARDATGAVVRVFVDHQVFDRVEVGVD